jgi:hypothetical protein
MKRRRRSTPLMLFWSRAEQRRFIDAVERLVATVNDLETLLRERRRRGAGRASKQPAQPAVRRSPASDESEIHNPQAKGSTP